MQDRFKIRAWNEETKSYFNPLDPSVNGLVLSIQGISGNFDMYGQDLNSDKFIMEQCTGIKDKNGKLIYEGDIVETHDYTTEHSQIVFDKGCYVLKSKDSAMYEHLSSYEEECKIIGNIHENPELLE